MRVLAIELRRSPMRWLAVIANLLVVYALVVSFNDWGGIWQRSTAAVSTVGLWWLPLAAAAQAWRANVLAREHADRLAEAGTVSPVRVSLVQLTAGCVWAFVPLLLGWATTVVMNWQMRPPGFLSPGFMALGVLGAWCAIGVGQLLGAFGGPIWFAPLTGALVVLLRILLSGADGYGLHSLPIVVSGAPSYVSMRGIGLLAVSLQTGLVLLLAVVAPWWWTRRHRFRLRRYRDAATAALASVACVGLLAGGIAVNVTAGPLVRQRTGVPPVCARDTPMTVCVLPEDAALLPRMRAVVEKVPAKIPTRLGLRAHGSFYESGAANPDPLNYGDDVGSLDMWLFTTNAAANVVGGSLYPDGQCDVSPNADKSLVAEESQRYFELVYWVTLRLYGQPPPHTGDSMPIDHAAVQALEARSQRDQIAWAEHHIRLLRSLDAHVCRTP